LINSHHYLALGRNTFPIRFISGFMKATIVFNDVAGESCEPIHSYITDGLKWH